MTATLGAAILLAPASLAKTPSACQMGRLLDVQANTELVPTIRVGRVHRNSNKDWTTVAPAPMRKETTYTIRVELGDMMYIARSSSDFFSYNPSKLIVNSEIEACLDSDRLVIMRPDGKQYKPTIIRREQVRSSPDQR